MIDSIVLSSDKSWCMVHIVNGDSFKVKLNPTKYLKDIENLILRIKQVYYEKAS